MILAREGTVGPRNIGARKTSVETMAGSSTPTSAKFPLPDARKVVMSAATPTGR